MGERFFRIFHAVIGDRYEKRQGTAAVQGAGARFGSPLKIKHSRLVLDGIFPVRDGGSHLFGGVEVGLDETGSEPGEGADEVVHDQDLAVAIRTGTDADGWDFEGGGDFFGNRRSDEFEDDGGGTGFFEGGSVSEERGSFGFRFALDMI